MFRRKNPASVAARVGIASPHGTLRDVIQIPRLDLKRKPTFEVLVGHPPPNKAASPMRRYPHVSWYADIRRSKIASARLCHRELHSQPGMNKAASPYKAVVLPSIVYRV